MLRKHAETRTSNVHLETPAWGDPNSLPAIEYVCEVFGLSKFERLILILCAAVELDSEVPDLCAKAHGNSQAPYPTFSLALAAFPGAQWNALTPVASLRRFRLISLMGLPQLPLTKCQLHIEERVLHYLVGISYIDRSLSSIIEPVKIEAPIIETHKATSDAIIQAWKDGSRNYFELIGSDETSKKIVAQLSCNRIGISIWQLPGELVPTQQDELDSMAQVWIRESALLNAGLYISAVESDDPLVRKAIRRLMRIMVAAYSGTTIFLSTDEPWIHNDLQTATMVFEVSKPTSMEQRALWKSLLQDITTVTTATATTTFTSSSSILTDNKDPDPDVDREIARITNQFNLNTSTIKSAASETALAIKRGGTLRNALWSASQKLARPRLDGLALKIMPSASIDDLVLPEREKQLLRSIIASVRQRYRVYEEWGFGANGRSVGIAALFAGDSGTGKTMAAEVLAKELELDLYKVDLSMMVSKYIGETEKNLKKIFDAAEEGGGILFFDEADALFGKRSEVRDSHDRYANIEVGYLLQRMETYRGLAVLTTNMKDALDKAFLRRLRFVVNFPFPNEKNRREIWKKVFPKSVPLDSSSIDFGRLAQLDITGGHIRNIALGAAVMAAEEGKPVGIVHIVNAAKEEYRKMDRPMPNVELIWK